MASPAIHRAIPSGRGGLHAGRIAELAEEVAAAAQAAPKKSLGLPPIPEGHIRLTHVMPDRSREILSSGEPFIYKKHGLGGTTDSYSNNEAIEHLAATGDPMFEQARQSGQPSNFTRNPFGSHMAIFDLPADAHKRIVLSHGAFDEPIPNAAILGFVDRGSMTFEPNPRYDLKAVGEYGNSAIDRIRQMMEKRSRRPMFAVPDEDPASVPPPTPTLSGNLEDIW